MQFSLSSNDTNTEILCREALADLFGQNWVLTCSPTPGPNSSDIYMWDVVEDFPPLGAIGRADFWRHYFFIDRANIQRFRDAFPDTTNVLLKPLTKPALSAFLSSVCERARTAQASSMDVVKADRDHILQCLFQTNLKLQEYDQERTNFLARAIHDFRAPLTAITGYCGLLLGGEDLGSLTEEQRQVLERMQRSATKLSRMATAMFQLSVCQRAEPVLDTESADIGDCVEQAVHEVYPTVQEKKLTVDVNLRPVSRPLFLNRTKIEQVLVNLLENACKFAPRGGSIQVAGYPWCWDGALQRTTRTSEPMFAHREPNSYRVDVSDSGPGIPSAHLNRIFEEYTSYGGGSDRSGGGLGLAICRMIIRQHQGRIWAENAPPGAVLSFVLPLGGHETAGQRTDMRAYAARHE